MCSQKEAEERIFFISAKEALQARLAEQGHTATTPLTEGFQTRYFEFQVSIICICHIENYSVISFYLPVLFNFIQ